MSKLKSKADTPKVPSQQELVDPNCVLIKYGLLTFKKDGSVNAKCAAVADGLVTLTQEKNAISKASKACKECSLIFN